MLVLHPNTEFRISSPNFAYPLIRTLCECTRVHSCVCVEGCTHVCSGKETEDTGVLSTLSSFHLLDRVSLTLKPGLQPDSPSNPLLSWPPPTPQHEGDSHVHTGTPSSYMRAGSEL